MRNETVERIVDLLFQDVEMSAEVQALYDETMSNCQERYQDMISRGLSEDDAIAAVVESLTGMEEVIDQYPKKSAAPSPAQDAKEEKEAEDGQDTDDADDGRKEFIFSPNQMESIDVTMICDDVSIEASNDDKVHVLFEDVEGANATICRVENGVLTIRRDPDASTAKRSSFTVHGKFADGKLTVQKGNGEYFFFKDDSNSQKSTKDLEADIERAAHGLKESLNGFTSSAANSEKSAETEKKGSNFEDMLSDFASSASRFGRELGKLFSSIKPMISLSGSIGGLTICLPVGFRKPVSVMTTSGDMDVLGVEVSDLKLSSTSGEIKVSLAHQLQQGVFASTSGDIEVTADAQTMQINTASGDVELCGHMDSVKATTSSGDMDLDVSARDCTFSSVSGDVTARLGNGIVQLSGNTTSGDIDVTLPDSIGENALKARSISGDITNRHRGSGSAVVSGSLRSVSGDIDIR